MAAAVEQLSNGERELTATQSRKDCLQTLYDEAGIEKTSAADKMAGEDIGAIEGMLRDRPYRTKPEDGSW